MISIVLVVTVCTTGSAIAQAVECDVPQYTFSDENIEIVDPALILMTSSHRRMISMPFKMIL